MSSNDDEAERDRDEANRKIDDLDACWPSTIDPSRSYQPLPQPPPRGDRPATPPPPTWLKQLADAKEIFRICEYKEDEDRLAQWISELAQTPSQAQFVVKDADSALLDVYNTEQEDMLGIAERNLEAAVRGMREVGDERWQGLQKEVAGYFHDKRKRAGSPAVPV
ncbi:hypothetical protein LTR36_004739 [Oleoguttula mirabilis]|uniref:Uncharacterized protein n=1 Tax=Oleoguttula mirabilis TaxID=1507867 RepID=A0AAV9JHK5_9PEZI|nr:hypothetical protein LTR36_004739 [Oleoguttula mirabilis]